MELYKSFFSEDLVNKLADEALRTDKRKQIFLLNFGRTPCPVSVTQAAEVINSKLGFSPNTAILKRYNIKDEYISKAYTPHKDPHKFEGSPLVFCSLNGKAELNVISSGSQSKVIKCERSTVVVLKQNEEHWVTPPLNKDGVRCFIFFGYDKTIL